MCGTEQQEAVQDYMGCYHLCHGNTEITACLQPSRLEW